MDMTIAQKNEKSLSRLPALKLLLITGICFIILILLPVPSLVLGIVTSFLILTFTVACFNKKYNIAYLSGAVSISCLLYLNFISNIILWENTDYEEHDVLFSGQVEKILSSNDRLIRAVISGEINSQSLKKIHSRILISIFKSSAEDNLIAGQTIYSPLRLRVPQMKHLYSDFDSRQYNKSYQVNFISKLHYRDLASVSEAGYLNLKLYESSEYIRSIISKTYKSQENRAIISALILGDKSFISSEIKHIFSITGTSHLLALSGLHIGIISVLLFFLLSFIRNKWLKLIVFSIALSFFVMMTGVPPSALRASSMAVLFMFIWNLQREANVLNIFSLVVLIMIIFNPNIILAVSFQLSVSAVFSIILLYKVMFVKLLIIKRDSGFIYRWLIASISISLSASLGVSAIGAYYFSVLPLLALFSNIVAVPLISLSLIWAIIGMFLFEVSEYIADLFFSSSAFLIEITIKVNELIANIPMAYVTGEKAMITSIIISAAFVYLLYSNNIKKLAFRFLVVIIVTIISLNYENADVLRITRGSHEIILVENDDYNYCLSIEKEVDEYPDYDGGLYKYLWGKDKKIYVFSTGFNGINTADNLLKNNKVMRIDLDRNDLNIIRERLVTTLSN